MATLATRPMGEPMLVKQVAAEAAIPEHFLAKLLQDLARHGLLKSNKGPGGGFRLVVAPALVPLLRVVEAVDGPDRYHRCIEGHAECNDRTVCALHDAWMPLKSHIVECLEGTTIADLAKSLSDKRRPLARSRRGGSRR